MSGLYDQDVVLWSEEQAKALREHARGSNMAVDRENVAEEIESLGNEQRLAISSHITTNVEPLLKLPAFPAQLPRHKWIPTVLRARAEVNKRLKKNPSLRREVPDMIEEGLTTARKLAELALDEHGEESLINLNETSYAEDSVLGDWLP